MRTTFSIFMLLIFEKVNLAAGETKTVQFTLTEKELGFYNNQGKFVVEKGEFDVMVDGSSAEEMEASFRLE